MNYSSLISEIVKEAGKLAIRQFRGDVKISAKKGGSIATEVDEEVEAFLKRELEDLIPGSGFLAEESGFSQGNEFLWVIDPIDGTKNFQRGLSYFCISVALEHRGVLIAAVTYAPLLHDLFRADLGGGSWLNESRIVLQAKDWTTIGLLGVGNAGVLSKVDRLRAMKGISKSLFKTSLGFRVCGAAALDIAYTAAGMFDIALFADLHWWDMAAGVLLIREAGGLVSQHDGTAVTEKSKSVICGNVAFCKHILPTLIDKKEYV